MKRKFSTRSRAFSAVCVGLAVVTLGCGTESGGADLEDLTPETFPTAFAEAHCKAGAECCATTFDKSACIAKSMPRDEIVPKEITSTTGAFDKKAAASCIAALSEAAGTCDPDTKLLAAALVLCQAVYPGTRKEDEACEVDADCIAVPPYGSRSSGCWTAGICSLTSGVSVTAQLGEPCDNFKPPSEPHGNCDESKDLWCNSTTRTCELRVPPGGQCPATTGSDAVCVIGYDCVLTAAPLATCVPGLPVGANCAECSELYEACCGTGSACDGVCKAVANLGEACESSPDFDGCVGSCYNGRCVTWGQGLTWAKGCK